MCNTRHIQSVKPMNEMRDVGAQLLDLEELLDANRDDVICVSRNRLKAIERVYRKSVDALDKISQRGGVVVVRDDTTNTEITAYALNSFRRY